MLLATVAVACGRVTFDFSDGVYVSFKVLDKARERLERIRTVAPKVTQARLAEFQLWLNYVRPVRITARQNGEWKAAYVRPD